MEGFGNLAVFDGLNIDRHYPEALSGVRHTEEVTSGRAGHITAHDHAVASDKHFLDVKHHVGDGVRKISNHLNRRLATPAFARQIARAGFIIGGKDLLLNGFDIASAGDVEQAVPRGDDSAGLCCRKSNPNIFVVQSAEDWAAKNAPCRLHGAR
jgi:hypothetical protein